MKANKLAKTVLKLRPVVFTLFVAALALLEVDLAFGWQKKLQSATTASQVQPVMNADANPWVVLANAH